MTEPLDRDCLDLLGQYDTPTVCNAIELFDLRPRSAGFMGGEIRALFPEMPPIVGYASTATFRSTHARQTNESFSNLADQVERMEAEIPRPRIIVFQDLDERPCGATFGEVMCTTYQSFGGIGLITNGGARDLDQVHAKGFVCFASTTIASHAHCRIVDVHVPVTVGGLLVRPGDLIHADRNGVTTVPSDRAMEIALACEKLAHAEGAVLGYLEGERSPTVEGLREAYLGMKKRFASIVEEVRRELRDGQARNSHKPPAAPP